MKQAVTNLSPRQKYEYLKTKGIVSKDTDLDSWLTEDIDRAILKYESRTSLQQVELPDGKTAINMSPESTQQLAIVNLSVIKRLTALLPLASPQDIIGSFQDKLEDLQKTYPSRTMLEDFINLMEDEVAFHRSVNLIATYDQPEAKEVSPRVGEVSYSLD
jgi:hypothetical protein